MNSPRRFLALAAVVAASATAWARRVDLVVPLGATADVAVAAPGDHATIGFLVTQGPGRQLAFQLKRAKGSTLIPVVALLAPDGTAFDIAANGGSVAAGATSWKAKLPNMPQTGLWRLDVQGSDGSTGHFTLSIKGKDTLKTSGTAAIPIGGAANATFVAGDGMTATVTVKRQSGSLVVPQFVVLDPSGVPLGSGTPFVAAATTGAVTVKGLRLPLFGKYTLRFSGATNAGGGLTYTVSTAPASLKGKLPVAVCGTSSDAEPGLAGQLDGSASESASGSTLNYRWAQVSGPSAPLTDPTSATPTFLAPSDAPASVAFQLAVIDGGTVSKSATIGVEVGQRPLADAGRSQSIASPATVTLDGSGSVDRKGAGLRYAWRQMPGDATAVTLTGADTPSPSFAPPAGTHVFHFGLTVDDGDVRSFEDVVVVGTGDTTRPVADAGREQYVRPMAAVHLSGLAGRTGSGVLDAAIQWTQISGPTVALAGATTPWPSFTAPASAGDFVFETTLNGAAGAADRVAVHVRSAETNLAPPARAFAPSVAAPGKVQLSAVGTADSDADPLTFQWAQVAGAGAPISGSAAATATATIPSGTDQYVFAVQANDGLAYGAPDIVSVRSAGFSARPVASAGPDRAADPGIVVTLDGSASARTDGGAGPLTYRWTQIGGKDWFDVAADVPTFDATAAKPAFALPIDVESVCPTETLVFQLVVDDGANPSLPDLVAVSFTNVPLNGKPSVTAAVSDANPVVGQTVTLIATAKDGDGDPLTVRWTQTSGPAVALSPDATASSPTFVAPEQGSMTFQIVARDGHWDSAPATVGVTVNRKPVATIAVSPGAGGIGTLVTMDGSGSSDPEGQALTYTWTQTAGPPVAYAQGATSVQFSAPSSNVSFRLVVSDGRQDSAPTTASFNAALPAPTPTSNASAGKAAYGSSVALAANPGQGGPFTYAWRQINPNGTDPAVSLSSTTAQNPTFTVPVPSTAAFGSSPSATFGVTASDGVRFSAEGTVTVGFYASFNATTLTSTTVYAIIASNCTACHSGTSNTCPIYSGYEFGMGTAAAFLANTRGVTSCSSTKPRLPSAGTTGQNSNAFLLDRLKGIGSSTMPPYTSLSGPQIRLIQDWIDQGSQNN